MGAGIRTPSAPAWHYGGVDFVGLLRAPLLLFLLTIALTSMTPYRVDCMGVNAAVALVSISSTAKLALLALRPRRSTITSHGRARRGAITACDPP